MTESKRQEVIDELEKLIERVRDGDEVLVLLGRPIENLDFNTGKPMTANDWLSGLRVGNFTDEEGQVKAMLSLFVNYPG